MRLIYALIAIAAFSAISESTDARQPRSWRAQNMARYYSWHGSYYHTEYGTPVALVVPPTAHQRTDWGWGVGNTRIRRIDHQFGRSYPGYGAGAGMGYSRTPAWPSDTTQFGVYPVRAPW